jgi:5-methylcytosine-specific restriction endonuclease McrA
MSRRGKEFAAKTKASAFVRAEGKCQSCALPIRGGPHYDHIIPIADGGDGSLENCQVLCAPCHSDKTKTDVTQIRRGQRKARKAINAVRRTSRPIQSRGFAKVERDRVRWKGPET